MQIKLLFAVIVVHAGIGLNQENKRPTGRGAITPQRRLLSEPQRRKVYMLLKSSQMAASIFADSLMPSAPQTAAQKSARTSYWIDVLTGYENAIGRRFQLNPADLEAISREGDAKLWPMIQGKPLAPQSVLEKPEDLRTWQEVTEFRGEVDRTTDDFDIEAEKWLIRWHAKPREDRDDQHFSITVHRTDGKYTELIVNRVAVEGSEVTYLRGAGSYYLKISADQPYVISIAEYKVKK